ncbi:hypothetical protein NKG94_30190 [Micromonospora sp. M12]
MSTVAVVLMLIVGGPLPLWIALVLVAGAVGAWWLFRRGGEPAPYGRWSHALLIALPLLPPLLLVFEPAYQWDAHSIWWLHAGYFSHGGEYARAAIGDPAFVFAHRLPTARLRAGRGRVERRRAGLPNRPARRCAGHLLRDCDAGLPGPACDGPGNGLGGLGARRRGRPGLLVDRLVRVAGGLADALWSAAFAGRRWPCCSGPIRCDDPCCRCCC